MFPASEKIHLHTDKEVYFPGETIWFKSYLLSEGLPSNLSTNLFTALTDANGFILQQKVVPVISATADGSFTLPDTLRSDVYYIRAYTLSMTRNDSTYSYIKKIKTIFSDTIHSTMMPEQGISFFPEGGTMVAQLHNHIALKANYNNGLPFTFSGVLKNSKGEVIDSIQSEHDGMGVFQLMPEANEKYFVYWKDDKNKDRRSALPESKAEGITMHTEQLNKQLYLTLQSTAQEGDHIALEIAGIFNNMEVFRIKAFMGKQHMFTAKIPLDSIPSGLLTLTVFNLQNLPIAEKLVFMDNTDFRIYTILKIVKKGTGNRAKNIFEIATLDTSAVSYSIAVYDANFEQTENTGSIYSDLLLTNDIRGYV